MTLYAQLMLDGAEYSKDKTSCTFSQQYQILGDGTEINILAAEGLPKLGDAHAQDEKAFLKSIRTSREGQSNKWVAICEYRKEPNPDKDPCAKDWEWSQDNWSKQEPLIWAYRVLDGEIMETQSYVSNSCGDDFAKPPVVERKYPTIKLSKNYKLSEAPYPSAFQDCVNDAEIKLIDQTIPKWCALIRDIRLKKVSEFVTVYDATGQVIDEYDGYLTLDIEIAINLEKWSLQIVDAGLNTWDEAAQKYVRITKNGRETDTDIPLDGNGGILDEASRKNKDFVLLEYLQYPEADFGPLFLPEVK